MQIKLDLRKSSGSGRFSPDSGGAHGSVNARRTVAVAARVRGFTKEEQTVGAKRAVSIDGNQISVVRSNIFVDADAEHIVAAAKLYDKGDWTSTFELDSLHWSCQEDGVGGGGASPPQSSQEDIYSDLGEDLVDNVLNGFSSSCFAYGPKDTGKSHCMFGEGSGALNSMGIEASSDGTTTMLRSAGLIPRVMSRIVSSLRKSKDTCDDTNITLSFAEVGHDKVFDMLVDPCSASAVTNSNAAAATTTELLLEAHNNMHHHASSTRKPLKLREHPDQGVYVENLRKAPVKSSVDLLRLLEEGIRRRIESRKKGHAAHCVVTLELTPARTAGCAGAGSEKSSPASPVIEAATADKPYGAITPAASTQDRDRARGAAAGLEDWTHTPAVKLHMVELADAVRHSTTDTETTAANANSKNHSSDVSLRRSLSTLGYIIQSLRDGDPSLMLPFRDSSLTWMLRDVLISPGHTAVLACVSPADTCCDDSINTLKFVSKMCAEGVRSGPTHTIHNQ